MEATPSKAPQRLSTNDDDGEFKQPFAVKQNWKVKNQEKHNSRLLGLLNTANLKMLQAIPAIGPKTAYILYEHRYEKIKIILLRGGLKF